jgi:N4-gp56 family major capsid protein
MSSRASGWCADTGDTTAQVYTFGFPVVFGMSCLELSATHAASAAVASISGNMGPIGVRKAVSRLRRLNVKPMANGKYIGIIHPNAVSGMLSNPDYKQWVVGYVEGPKETMYKHQVAEVHGVSFVESSNMPRFEGSLLDNRGKNLNISIILGQGALAMTELDGGIKFMLHKGPQTSSVFELYSTLAYKVRAAAAVTNPSCGVILITNDLVAPITTVA